MKLFLQLAACFALAAISAAAAGGAGRAHPAIPSQPWYPAGYLELRKAAAGEVASFPRDHRVIVDDDFELKGVKDYDLIDCALGDDVPQQASDRDYEMVLLALDIARMRSEMRGLGYLPSVYDAPLLEYEHASLDGIAKGQPGEWYHPPGKPTDADATDTSEDELADDDAAVETPSSDGTYVEPATDLTRLRDALEARRKRLQPGKPHFIVEGGCGGGEAEFTIRLQPAKGELWLINAFAFRVCELKVANPWDHHSCGWTQYLEGDKTFASGRYMYEASWGPKIQRGARMLQGDLEGNEGGVITFRRN